MNLKEERPLIFFDCETTGVNMSKDKIIQLAVVSVNLVTKKMSKKSWMFNPGMPIPKESTEIHGITDAMVANSPKFSSVAKEIIELMKSGIPAGYNINTFDIPLVKRELFECGEDISFMNEASFVTLDVFKIIKKLYARSLGEMYLRYTGKELNSAHDAMADTMASYELLACMLKQEDSVPDTVKGINDFYYDEKWDSLKKADVTGKLVYDKDGVLTYNFGKCKGKPVGDKDEDVASYALWVINSPDKFAADTIQLIRNEIK